MKQVKQAEVERCWPSMATWMIAPCQNSCPVRTDVPGYIMAIAQGDFKKAYDIAREHNPFPAVCGYICHHPCEDACNREKIDEPISIKLLKRFAADYVLDSRVADKPAPAERMKEERVAIIGSGPAGLTAAHDLVKQGYGVTVYEALPVTGGMLTLGIPEFVLPRDVLQAEIDYIKGLGVEIKTNTPFGKDLTLDSLRQQGYEAIFLGIGAQESLKLNIPGIDLGGVLYAIPLLRDLNLGKKVKFEGKVGIIGGGDVAIDLARVALRSGAREVYLTCLESRREMSAHPWEVERAEEEGVKIYPSLAPQKFIGKDGKVARIDFAKVKSIELDAEGRIRPILVEGKETAMDADRVVIAIGQTVDSSFSEGARGLKVKKRGTIEVDPDSLATNLAGVFAGGDVLTGRGTVIESIAAGKEAAISIDRYLRGVDLKEGRVPEPVQVVEPEEEKIPKFIEKRERGKVPTLPIAKRISSFKEVELGFPQEVAIDEAKRCLNCPVCGNCIFVRSQMCYETAMRAF